MFLRFWLTESHKLSGYNVLNHQIAIYAGHGETIDELIPVVKNIPEVNLHRHRSDTV